MVKTFSYSLLSFPLFIIALFFTVDVKITQKAPERANPDDGFEVSVHIEKGNVSGFAKYQFKVPAGVEIQEIESAAATFTFSNNQAKFIWLNLPEDEAFTIKYKVIASNLGQSALQLRGTFSYLENNERKSIDANELRIDLGDLEEVAEALQPRIEVERKVEEISGNLYNVEVIVSKQAIEGFGRVEEFVPKDAVVNVLKNDQKASFTFVGNKVKFVWVSMPADEELKVAYQIDLSASDSKTLNSLKGELSYISNGETVKLEIIGGVYMEKELATIESDAKEMAVEEMSNTIEDKQQKYTNDTKLEKENETRTEKNGEKMPVEELNKRLQAENSSKSKVDSKFKPENGVSFKVQIAAGKKTVSKNHFAQTYSFNGEYFVENHQGWIKYTVGSFNAYKQARDSRNQLTAQHTFPGPFVAAYNQGERITVQEALMITNQQWVK